MNKTIDGLTIVGNKHWIEIVYDVPDWNKENEGNEDNEEECFYYEGQQYFLSEIVRSEDEETYKKFGIEIHGVMGHTYFSGILVELHETGEAVRVYRFYQ